MCLFNCHWCCFSSASCRPPCKYYSLCIHQPLLINTILIVDQHYTYYFCFVQDNEKAKILAQFVAGFVLLSFVLGVLINRPEIPLSMNGILTKLSGESALVLMSLLGATLVPHNFYLHSSIVQVLFTLVFACFWIYLHLLFCLFINMKCLPLAIW